VRIHAEILSNRRPQKVNRCKISATLIKRSDSPAETLSAICNVAARQRDQTLPAFLRHCKNYRDECKLQQISNLQTTSKVRQEGRGRGNVRQVKIFADGT